MVNILQLLKENKNEMLTKELIEKIFNKELEEEFIVSAVDVTQNIAKGHVAFLQVAIFPKKEEIIDEKNFVKIPKIEEF